MFAYCGNCPANYFDPAGTCRRALGFLWKVDCKDASCPQSKCYNPSVGRVAVLYDDRSNHHLGELIGDGGFRNQGEALVELL